MELKGFKGFISGIVRRGAAITVLFALALCAFPISSEGRGDEPRIVAYTLSLRETVYVMYAVSLPEGQEGGIIVFEGEPPTKYAHGMGGTVISKTQGYTSVGGEKCYVYAYSGLSAKEMSVPVYAVPYTVNGGSYVYGAPSKYSIIQYANAKMSDSDSEPLLHALLDYGAAAQEYFNFNTKRPANAEYVKINVHGALLPDGMAHGMFLAGEKLPEPAPKVGFCFGGWFSDSEFNERCELARAECADVYAKWHPSVVCPDFSELSSPTSASVLLDGVLFNNEERANMACAYDERGIPYLEYKNGAATSIVAAKTYVGKSFADMSDTDVFSFSIHLRALSGYDALTSSEIAVESDKDTDGLTKWCKLGLASIEKGGKVLTHLGKELGALDTCEVFELNVALDFNAGTLAYYGSDGQLAALEYFTVPKESGAKSAKEWQSLVRKYLLYMSFNGGEALGIYRIGIFEGNLWS